MVTAKAPLYIREEKKEREQNELLKGPQSPASVVEEPTPSHHMDQVQSVVASNVEGMNKLLASVLAERACCECGKSSKFYRAVYPCRYDSSRMNERRG